MKKNMLICAGSTIATVIVTMGIKKGVELLAKRKAKDEEIGELEEA